MKLPVSILPLVAVLTLITLVPRSSHTQALPEDDRYSTFAERCINQGTLSPSAKHTVEVL